MEPHADPLDPWRRRFRPGLALAAVAALVGRLIYLEASGVDDVTTFQQGDAFWYSAVAAAMANGDFFANPFYYGTPAADHPPLTVVLLTPMSWLFPDSTLAQRLTMVVTGTLTVVVVGLAGRRLAGARVGLVAAVLAALLPALWVNDALIMSEAPLGLLVAVILYLGIVLSRRTSLPLALAAGAACGVAALTRAETGLFLPLMVWPLLATSRGVPVRDRLLQVAATTAAAGVVMAPWVLYNQTQFDEPVAISTNDGLTMLGSNCRTTQTGPLIGAWVIDPCIRDFLDTLDDRKPPAPAPQPDDLPCPDPNQHRHPCWDASTVSRLMRAEGLDYARGHLSRLPRLLYARNGRTWGWYGLAHSVDVDQSEGRPTWASRLGYWACWAMIPAAVAGALVLRRRRVRLLPFGAALAIVVIVTSLFHGLARFRLPYDVASCLLVAVAVVAGTDALRARRAP